LVARFAAALHHHIAVFVDLAQRPVRLALVVLGGTAAGILLGAAMVAALHFDMGGMGAGQDAYAYWHAVRGTMYGADPGNYGAYLYSPAFAQILSPILSLDWPVFMAIWTAVLIGILLVLAGPLIFVLMLPIAFFEIWGGNIHLLLALAIVIGFRHPAAWSFVLLTKVTPGVGLLWFAVRKEWRHLAVALGATVAVLAVSWLIDPQAWRSWLHLLTRQVGAEGYANGSIPIPLGLRLPLAAVIVVFAAATDRKWLVPVGALVAMPVLWWGGLSVLIGSVALERRRLEPAVMRAIDRALQPLRELRGAHPATAKWAPEPES
jgi:hypothetical protein